MLPRTKKLGRWASDRSYACTREAAPAVHIFRNHLTSERRAYFRLAGQLSQLCAQTLHIFAYSPRMVEPRRRERGGEGEGVKTWFIGSFWHLWAVYHPMGAN